MTRCWRAFGGVEFPRKTKETAEGCGPGRPPRPAGLRCFLIPTGSSGFCRRKREVGGAGSRWATHVFFARKVRCSDSTRLEEEICRSARTAQPPSPKRSTGSFKGPRHASWVFHRFLLVSTARHAVDTPHQHGLCWYFFQENSPEVAESMSRCGEKTFAKMFNSFPPSKKTGAVRGSKDQDEKPLLFRTGCFSCSELERPSQCTSQVGR